MAIIVRNEYGAVAVNKGVMERMIVGDLLDMSEQLLLCTKKGKVIKEKPTPFIDPDYFDALEYSDKHGELKAKVYIIVKNGHTITGVAERIFSSVEAVHDMLGLARPAVISVKVKGMQKPDGEIQKRSTEVVRSNA